MFFFHYVGKHLLLIICDSHKSFGYNVPGWHGEANSGMEEQGRVARVSGGAGAQHRMLSLYQPHPGPGPEDRNMSQWNITITLQEQSISLCLLSHLILRSLVNLGSLSSLRFIYFCFIYFSLSFSTQEEQKISCLDTRKKISEGSASKTFQTKVRVKV